jgi:spore germination protein GerM
VSKRGFLVALSIALILIATVLTFTFWLLDQPIPGPEETAERTGEDALETTPSSPVEEELDVPAERRIQITLYLLSRSGKTLAPEDREIPLADSVQEQAKQVVRELLAGSRQGLASPLPRGVELRELFITPQGLAFVDLSQELIANHIGGSCAEELTVYSLSNTLIVNFPAVKSVQFLVEGREVPTLAGHLDLTVPYGRGPRRLEHDSTSGP